MTEVARTGVTLPREVDRAMGADVTRYELHRVPDVER